MNPIDNIGNEDLIRLLTIRLAENSADKQQIQELNEQLKTVNKKLEEAEGVKSHFISNVRNQIINPFASVLGLSKNILQLKQGDWKKVEKMTNLIYSEAFELDFQLKNIFAAAKLEAGDTMIECNQVDVVQLMEDIITTFEYRAEQKQIQIKLITNLDLDDGGAFHFHTDPLKIDLIISNLLANAIEYSSATNTVELVVSMAGEMLQIAVRDEGIGIDEIDLRIIFDRFKKLDTSINSINRGHGLGLSVCKSLIDLLEGTIDVESKKTVGSTFIIRLPQSRPTTDENFVSEGDEFFDDMETF